jgi:hypothetical protein
LLDFSGYCVLLHTQKVSIFRLVTFISGTLEVELILLSVQYWRKNQKWQANGKTDLSLVISH